ncbi:MAG: peptidylprolyl isomerase [Terricaulis sp.]
MKHTLIQTAQNEPQAEAFSGCSHGPVPAARRPANAPPVFVNGIAIPETAIAQEAQNHDAASGPEARAAAARALVIRELLLIRARALALEPAPARDAHGREETDEEALVRQVLDLEVTSVEPSEAECRRVYESTASQFTAPELYEASHILFAPKHEGEAAWVAAYERAAAAIKAIGAEEPFAEWARACSACPTAEQGGALGQLQRGDLADDLERALMTLEPGQLGANPVRTRHGWHVIRLDQHSAAKELPFEVVEAFIKASLRTRAWATSSARYVAALAASTQIEGLSLSLGSKA